MSELCTDEDASFIPGGAPLRLSALQRRHIEQQQAKQQQDENETEYESAGEQSPAFSIFTPSVIALPTRQPAPSSTELSRNPSVERQAARSNLIRKLSKRDLDRPSNQTSAHSNGGYQGSGSPNAEEIISDFIDSPTTLYAPSPTSTVYTRPSSIATDAPSEFRSYNHHQDRDRDSAFAQLMMEDQFEYAGVLGGRKASHTNYQDTIGEDAQEEVLVEKLAAPNDFVNTGRKASSDVIKSGSRSRSSSNSSQTGFHVNGKTAQKYSSPQDNEFLKVTPFPAPSSDYQFPSNVKLNPVHGSEEAAYPFAQLKRLNVEHGSASTTVERQRGSLESTNEIYSRLVKLSLELCA